MTTYFSRTLFCGALLLCTGAAQAGVVGTFSSGGTVSSTFKGVAGQSSIGRSSDGTQQRGLIFSAPPGDIDLLIKKRTDLNTAYALDGKYQSTPSDEQIVTQAVPSSGVASYSVRVQNDDAAVTRSFVVKAEENATEGWSVAYRVNLVQPSQVDDLSNPDTVDIKAALTSAEGWSTPSLAPGDFVMIRVELRPDSGAASSSVKSSTLSVYLDGADTTVRDSVQAVATAPADVTAPASSVVITPAHSSSIGSNNLTEISGSASDSVGVVKVLTFLTRNRAGVGTEYWGLNGATNLYEWSTTVRSSVATVIPAGGQSVTWKRTNGMPKGDNLPAGTYSAQAKAFDAAGNSTASASNTFTVVAPASDTDIPTSVAVTDPGHNASVSTLTQVSGTASDNAGGSGINRVFVKLWKVVGTAKQWWGLNPSTQEYEWAATERMIRVDTVTPVNGETVTWSLNTNLPEGSDLPPDTYYVNARAYDGVGNNKYSATNTFTVAAPVSAPLMSAQSSEYAATESEVTLSSAVAQVGGSNEAVVQLTFSEVIDGDVAGDASRYSVSVNGEQVAVQSVLYDALTKTVTLSLSVGALSPGDQVVVQWSGLLDTPGKPLADGSRTMAA